MLLFRASYVLGTAPSRPLQSINLLDFQNLGPQIQMRKLRHRDVPKVTELSPVRVKGQTPVLCLPNVYSLFNVLLFCLLFNGIGFYYVAQVGLELFILQPLLLGCWDYIHVPHSQHLHWLLSYPAQTHIINHTV